MTLPFGPTLRQPDQTSCGAACVVVDRLLRTPGAAPTATSFAQDVLETHRQLVSSSDGRGQAQIPWPSGLGTPPWAVGRALSATEGVPYRTRVARWSASSAFATAVTSVATRPVALYLGSSMIPRHVVLAISAGTDGLSVYDPASGELVTITQAAWVGSRIHVAGWDVPWFVVQAG
jgi:hypothetical protein